MAPRRPEPAPDAHEALQPGDGRIGVDALDVALGPGDRVEVRRGQYLGCAVRRRQQVAGPTFEVQLGGAEAAGPGHEHGRRAPDRSRAARRGRTTGSDGAEVSAASTGPPLRKSCFHRRRARPGRAPFRTTLLANCWSKADRGWPGPLGLADDDPDGDPRHAASGCGFERQAGGQGGGPHRRGCHGARLAGRRGARVRDRSPGALPGEPGRVPRGGAPGGAPAGRPDPPRPRRRPGHHRADRRRGHRRRGAVPAPGRCAPRRDLRGAHHPRGDRLPAGVGAHGRERPRRAAALRRRQAGGTRGRPP